MEPSEARYLEQFQQSLRPYRQEQAKKRLDEAYPNPPLEGLLNNLMDYYSEPKNIANTILDFIPGIGDVKAVQEAAMGRSLVNNQKLNWLDRGLSALSALPLIPGLYAGKQALGFGKSERKFSSMADKMERFEIPDVGSKFAPNVNIVDTTLGEIFKHDELFENYPELKNLDVLMEIHPDLTPKGSYVPKESRSAAGLFDIQPHIVVAARNKEEARDTILHEIEHWIQEKEGFALGGSPSSVYVEAGKEVEKFRSAARKRIDEIIEQKDQYVSRRGQLGEDPEKAVKEFWKYHSDLSKELDDLWKTVNQPGSNPKIRYEAYKKLAGEIEARDVEARSRYGGHVLNTPPYSSENIPLSDWIVRHK